MERFLDRRKQGTQQVNLAPDTEASVVLQVTAQSRLDQYLSQQLEFNRRRRKLKLDFDTLYRLFASGMSSRQIAKRAGVSRPRISLIYNQYFRKLLGITDLQRMKRQLGAARMETWTRVASEISKDRVLRAISRSAAKAGSAVEPILLERRGEPRKRFRHRAVLVNGRSVELVYHLQNAHTWPSGAMYATTSVSRSSLESCHWCIFFVDPPSQRQHFIRCRSRDLLKALFDTKTRKTTVYIPLGHRPTLPRYDFLADEDNWP